MTATNTCSTTAVRFACQLLGLLLVTMVAGIARGSSVRSVTVAEMLAHCELVFEGYVVGRRPYQDTITGMIHTNVIFEVLDVLKGRYSKQSIALSFLGGTVGDATLALGDMQIPEQGEKGIYFVESLRRRQVHPLYGWSQGHFLVVTDGRGVERVLTESRRPVAAMSAKPQQKSRRFSSGIARGVTVLEGDQRSGAMTITNFKKHLSAMQRIRR